MKKMVNVHEAKTHLSRLLERVQTGEEIIIAKSGEPFARLAPVRDRPAKRQAGTLKGLIEISEGSFEALPHAGEARTEVRSQSVLLDTHTLLWWAANDRRLSSKARKLIESEDTAVLVDRRLHCSASPAET